MVCFKPIWIEELKTLDVVVPYQEWDASLINVYALSKDCDPGGLYSPFNIFVKITSKNHIVCILR